MTAQNLILIISILTFTSCKEITKDDIKGNWIVIPDEYKKPIFEEINFKEDIIELVGDNLFKEVGEYQLENGKIEIQLDRDDLRLETKIYNLNIDTLLIFDSLTYHRNRGITNSRFKEYKLIGIPTNRFLSNEKTNYRIIHFYKSENKEIKIRLGEKLTNYQDVPLFLSNGHSTPKVMIFIGKGITLKELKTMYYYLLSSGQSRIWLGTKREGISDTHIYRDKIEIWWEDLENHLRSLKIIQPVPPPPPIEFLSKEKYLNNGGIEVRVLNNNDLRKINGLKPTEKYVISINSNLSIESYIELKRRLIEKRKLNKHIITEIE